jgi:hydroxymethylpyrimidine/phosphomethylpyrimidine kinase
VTKSRPPTALSIAGSDPSGGAGVQADLKTFAATEVYGCAAITALTVQDTTGVHAVHPVAADIVSAQVIAVLADLPVDAVKVGLLGSAQVARAVAEALTSAAHGPVVLDPILAASDGTNTLDDAGQDALRARLLPITSVLTPNLPEAATLLERTQGEVASNPERACRELLELGPGAVLLKGGHAGGAASDDLLWDGRELTRLSAARLDSRNTHGTGCVLSSALAAHLARGLELADAARAAKRTVTAAIEAARGWELGAGRGPLQPFGQPWT